MTKTVWVVKEQARGYVSGQDMMDVYHCGDSLKHAAKWPTRAAARKAAKQYGGLKVLKVTMSDATFAVVG